MTVICDYCNAPANFLPTSEAIYAGKDYGPMFVCWPCDAWCGCHKGTTRPLGRLANPELRLWKRKAHAVFDPIWQERLDRKRRLDSTYNKGMARGGRYKKLAELLGIPKQECHIGMFDVDLCKRAVAICESGKLAEETTA